MSKKYVRAYTKRRGPSAAEKGKESKAGPHEDHAYETEERNSRRGKMTRGKSFINNGISNLLT